MLFCWSKRMLIFCCLLVPAVLGNEVIPNIGYLFRGYHLYKGNPLATQVTSDPGFQNLIFEPQFSRNTVSGDLKYLVPDGTKVYPKEGCTQAFNNELIQDAEQYKVLLRDMVKTNYTGFDHSFRGSADYQQVHAAHDSDSSTQTLLTQIICLKYEAVLDTVTLPPYSSVFVAEVRKAYAIFQRNRTDADATNRAIHNLVSAYGTHFVRKIELGSRYTYQNHLNSNHRYALEQAGLDMRAGAVLSMTRKMGHQLTQEELEMSHEFDKLVSTGRSSSSSFSYNPDGSLDTQSSTPIPLYYEIQRLDELFVKTYMKTAGVDYKKFKVLLENYFNNYCELEKRFSGVDRCADADGSTSSSSSSSSPSFSLYNFNVQFSDSGINSLLWREKLPKLTSFTASWWMRAEPYSSDSEEYRYILSYSSFSPHLAILATPEEQGGCIRVELDGQPITSSSSSCLVPFDGNYHHYVVTWSSQYGRWQIYIDGNLWVGGSANRGFLLPEGGYLVVGQQQDAGIALEDPLTVFRGDIAYLHVWDFAVNGVEARMLAQDNGRVEGNVVSWNQEKLRFVGEGLDVSPVISDERFYKA